MPDVRVEGDGSRLPRHGLYNSHMTALRPRRRRQVGTIALFLLQGALATVVVAWVLCMLGTATPLRTENGGMRWARGEVLDWPVHVPANWPQPTFLYGRIGRGLRIDVGNAAMVDVEVPQGAIRQMTQYSITSVRSGWPLLAMQSRTIVVRHNTGAEHIDRTPAIPLPFWLRQYVDGISEGYGLTRVLPLAPVWPAFLASTLLYALAFWIVLRLPRALRTFIRLRRGHCTQCGYPRGSSDVCTECGAPLPAGSGTPVGLCK